MINLGELYLELQSYSILLLISPLSVLQLATIYLILKSLLQKLQLLQRRKQITCSKTNCQSSRLAGTTCIIHEYTITNFHSIGWMSIYVNVTIYRTVILQMYQSGNSHCIMMIITTKLRSSIQNQTIKSFESAAATLCGWFLCWYLDWKCFK